MTGIWSYKPVEFSHRRIIQYSSTESHVYFVSLETHEDALAESYKAVEISHWRIREYLSSEWK